jgi:hypothetical protein
MMKFSGKDLEKEMIFIRRDRPLHRYKLLIDENEKVVDDLGPVGFAFALEPKIEFNAIHHKHIMLNSRACNKRRIGKFMVRRGPNPTGSFCFFTLDGRGQFFHGCCHTIIIRNLKFYLAAFIHPFRNVQAAVDWICIQLFVVKKSGTRIQIHCVVAVFDMQRGNIFGIYLPAVLCHLVKGEGIAFFILGNELLDVLRKVAEFIPARTPCRKLDGSFFVFNVIRNEFNVDQVGVWVFV